MELSFQKLGAGHPLIILHGLYGSGDNWLTIGRKLSSMFEVILPDQRNHGSSPWSDQMDYAALAGDLHEMMDRLGIGRAAILGHSMGGKAAMWFATENPGRVSHLVVADIGPRSYLADTGPSNHMDEHASIISALGSVDLAAASSLGEVDHALEPGIPSRRLRQFLLKNLQKNGQGHYAWKINLASIRNNLTNLADGLDLQALHGKSFTQFPVLFIKGEKSPYILSPDIELIHGLFPMARLVTIRNTGHWLHAEEPEIFTGLVKKFIVQPGAV
jgi:esterase